MAALHTTNLVPYTQPCVSLYQTELLNSKKYRIESFIRFQSCEGEGGRLHQSKTSDWPRFYVTITFQTIDRPGAIVAGLYTETT